CVASRRSRSRKDRSGKVGRGDQGARRALKMTGARGRSVLAPRVHLTMAVLGPLILTACHHGPPRIIPPQPTAPRITELQRNINTILAAPALARGSWGVLVKSLASDETLYALNVHK